jgi:hypothetical protein
MCDVQKRRSYDNMNNSGGDDFRGECHGGGRGKEHPKAGLTQPVLWYCAHQTVAFSHDVGLLALIGGQIDPRDLITRASCC